MKETRNNLEYMEQLDDNIVKIRKIVRVGPGDFDFIGINRVKKNVCECSSATVVFAPGANSDFTTSFDKLSLFLAQRDIDVWGIDFRYSFVPDNIDSNPYCLITGCNFMKDWITSLHISDLDMIIKMAELSSSNGKVFLSGWSQGAFFAYRYAKDHLNLNGIIPIDIIYNLDPVLTDIADKTRIEIAQRNSKINSGIFYEDVLLAKFLAFQALNNPNGPSEVIPGFTNQQAALLASTATFQFGINPIPNYRYNQGDLTGLKYTDLQYALQQSLKLNSFQSIFPLTELRQQWLDPTIPSITVPILHVGAEFGFSAFGFYTPNLIHNFNSDVETFLVPDYGHVDLVYSTTGAHDVWQHIFDWINNHKRQ